MVLVGTVAGLVHVYRICGAEAWLAEADRVAAEDSEAAALDAHAETATDVRHLEALASSPEALVQAQLRVLGMVMGRREMSNLT